MKFDIIDIWCNVLFETDNKQDAIDYFMKTPEAAGISASLKNMIKEKELVGVKKL